MTELEREFVAKVEMALAQLDGVPENGFVANIRAQLEQLLKLDRMRQAEQNKPGRLEEAIWFCYVNSESAHRMMQESPLGDTPERRVFHDGFGDPLAQFHVSMNRLKDLAAELATEWET